jgi:hypothetical protein
MNVGDWYINDTKEYIYIIEQKGFDRWDTVWFQGGVFEPKFWPDVELDFIQWSDYEPKRKDFHEVVSTIFEGMT